MTAQEFNTLPAGEWVSRLIAVKGIGLKRLQALAEFKKARDPITRLSQLAESREVGKVLARMVEKA